MEIANKLQAIVIIPLILVFLYFTTSWARTIADLQSDTLTKALFWVSYVLVIISAVVLKPIILSSNEDISKNPITSFLGILLVFGIGLVSIVTYDVFILFSEISILNNVTMIKSLMGFLYVILISFMSLAIPNYVVLYK